MPGDRASKRRKLDNDAAPHPVEVATSNSITHSQGMNGIPRPTKVNGAANDTAHAATTGKKKRSRRSDVVSSPQPPSTSELFVELPTSAVKSNGIHKLPANDDVDMEDAPSVTVDSVADSMDADTPRTSGRARQKSRKLEEAEGTSARSSSAASKSRRGSVRQTPSKTNGTASKETPSRSAKKTTPGRARKGSSPTKRIPSPVVQETITVQEQPPASDADEAEIPTADLDGPSQQLLQEIRVSAHAETPPPVTPKPKAPVRRKRASTVKRSKATVIPDSEPEDNQAQRNGKVDPQPPATLPSINQSQIVEQHEVTRNSDAATSLDGTAAVDLVLVARLTQQHIAPTSGPLQPRIDNDTPMIDVSLAPDDLSNGAASGELGEFKGQEILAIQFAIMQRLTRRSHHRLIGLDTEIAKVSNLIEQTVTAGESNSMVLIGARGSGKTAIVESILAKQRLTHADDFLVVRLNGFIHTDDRVAIREIWRQLGREMEIEEDSNVKNYADTMTTLLALLSHPSETGQAEAGRMAKSVIIILEEFDLFTTHPRQTLLYNLFDIAQSRKAPLAVLGLTTRYDVAESLEKRVKSRFSHRQVYIPLAKTFASFKTMCQSCLTLSPSEDNAAFMNFKLNAKSLCQRWSTYVANLLETSTTINTHLQYLFHTTKSIPAFQSSLLIPISTIRSTAPLSAEDLTLHLETSITLAPSLAPPDSSLILLPSLSTLEFALLIAAARLLIIHDADAASFPLAYDEYKSLASKARIAASAQGALATGSGARVWGPAVARLAWEGLLEKGLVLPVADHRARGGSGLCRVDVSLEELGAVVDASVDAAGMSKWCKEI